MVYPCPTIHYSMCRGLHWPRVIAFSSALRHATPSSTAPKPGAFWRVWGPMRSLRSNLEILKGPAVRICIWGGIALCLALLAGCQQEMAQQPRHEPLAASAFFEDGRSSRDLVPGTVARGQGQEAVPWSPGGASGEAVTTLPWPLTH